MARVDHIPQGDPYCSCGERSSKHRIDHAFHQSPETSEDTCFECGWPAVMHRSRKRKSVTPKNPKPRISLYKKVYVGIDGEGQGRDDHKYVLLAINDEDDQRRAYIDNFNGLSTDECLRFIFNLPEHYSLFSFSFNYDLTKILWELPNSALYRLFRPELRQRLGREAYKGPHPVRWNDWVLNLQGSKFSVAWVPKGEKKINVKSHVIWDVFKFYQKKFTGALLDWKVGNKAAVEAMQRMKDKRHEFDQESREKVREYCFNECRYMATLARKLDEAHAKAGLKLKNYFGAGSSASAMLNKIGIKEYMTKPPEELTQILAAAFFGGRFDHSMIGGYGKEIHSYDISSAYPYQCVLLPCLTHGQWLYTNQRRDIDSARLACIHYGLGDRTPRQVDDMGWGPFPYRTKDGSICYPATSGGGWVWKDEYLAAERYYGHVYFKEAWVYHTDCDCQPFKDVPQFYLERLAIGKEGAGIILKLAMNSLYGKTAQSVGNGPFNNWVWAGNITSGTRAQIIDMLAQLRDPWDMLMVATDGIHSTVPLTPALPCDTNTDVLVTDVSTGETARKPLGGWEWKPVKKGVFYARPGVYFPMNPTEEEKEKIRGRGVGRGVILENWRMIVSTWEDWIAGYIPSFLEPTWPTIHVKNVTRFCGAKTCISRSQGPDGKYVYTRANGNHLKAEVSYGQWIDRQVAMSFDPSPKRAGLHEDKRRTRLRYTDGIDELSDESTPYKKALLSPEAKEWIAAAAEMIEQPDADFSEYDCYSAES